MVVHEGRFCNAITMVHIYRLEAIVCLTVAIGIHVHSSHILFRFLFITMDELFINRCMLSTLFDCFCFH